MLAAGHITTAAIGQVTEGVDGERRAAARAAVFAITRSDLRARLQARAGAMGETALLALLDSDLARQFELKYRRAVADAEQSYQAFRDLVWELAEDRAVVAALELSSYDLDDGASWRQAHGAACSIASFVVYEDCYDHLDSLFGAELAALRSLKRQLAVCRAAPFPRL